MHTVPTPERQNPLTIRAQVERADYQRLYFHDRTAPILDGPFRLMHLGFGRFVFYHPDTGEVVPMEAVRVAVPKGVDYRRHHP